MKRRHLTLVINDAGAEMRDTQLREALSAPSVSTPARADSRLVYLDQNIVHYLVRGFPADVDGAVEAAALGALRSAGYRIALSEAHIVEAKQNKLDPHKFGTVVDNLDPLWMHDQGYVVGLELFREIAISKGARPPPISIDKVASASFAQLVFQNNHDVVTLTSKPIYLSIERYLRMLADNGGQDIQAAQRETVEALRIGQMARKTGAWDAMQPIINRAALDARLPHEDALGRAISEDERKRHLDRWMVNLPGLYANAPTVHAEELATVARADDAGRKPKQSDALDLQHLLVPLVYCDAIVSSDGYLRTTADKVARGLPKAARRFKLPSDAADALLGPGWRE